ncbi:MAG: hypothetical protein AAF092_11380 [Pseudomonadota bacterium]
MTEAEKAYAAAERLIEEARENDGAYGISFERPEFKYLHSIPPQISDLPRLTNVCLNFTEITDLEPLRSIHTIDTLAAIGCPVVSLTPLCELTRLSSLYLQQTLVEDLQPLAGCSDLRVLVLDETEVSDLRPLAKLTDLRILAFGRTRVSDLTPLSKLEYLESISASDTPVNSIEALATLRWLTRIGIQGTMVSDLRPLLKLRRLRLANEGVGVDFRRTRATEIDAELKRLASPGPGPLPTKELFAYLEDWVPPGTVAKPPATEVQREPALGTIAQAVLSTPPAKIRAVLRQDYPQFRARAAHLVEQVAKEQAAHAVMPIPNTEDGVEEYYAKKAFLDTVKAGLITLYDDLPEGASLEIGEPEAKGLRDKLVEVAKTADQAIAYLDAQDGTYGGLYKIGLISSVAGLMCLIPGVSFLPAILLPAGVLGAKTIKLHVKNKTGS